MKPELRRKIGRHWDAAMVRKQPKRTKWWESPLIRSHINRLVCGKPLPYPSAGLRAVLCEKLDGRKLSRAVSVGCGAGTKEMRLLEIGAVDHFLLFDFSQKHLAKGKDLAAKRGLLERVTFSTDDAFSVLEPGSVDLVYWDMSLHHMLDVYEAVRWSHDVLVPNGYFVMMDFVGPTRFQWSEQSLALAARVRAALPQRCLHDPYKPDDPDAMLPQRLKRTRPETIATADPSEAAQSGEMLNAIRRYFPDAEVTPAGGTIYHLALRDVIHNIDEGDETDRGILNLLLLLDELSIELPGIDCHYAAAIATRK